MPLDLNLLETPSLPVRRSVRALRTRVVQDVLVVGHLVLLLKKMNARHQPLAQKAAALLSTQVFLPYSTETSNGCNQNGAQTLLYKSSRHLQFMQKTCQENTKIKWLAFRRAKQRLFSAAASMAHDETCEEELPDIVAPHTCTPELLA
jgi:hypothetical protein